MTTQKLDPDVERWGLHLLDVCTLGNDTSQCVVTGFDRDCSNVEYVSEGFADPYPSYTAENNPGAGGPRGYQENLPEALQGSAVLQESWVGSLGRNENGNDWKIENSYGGKVDVGDLGNNEASTVIKVNGENSIGETDRDNGNAENRLGGIYTYGLSGENAMNGQDLSYLLDIADEYSLDSEVGRRLNDMIPVPHVPKTVEKIPSIDEAVSDHERLIERLQLYFLVERKVQGDGNCQFRALSDQLYRSGEHHGFVREQIVQQLKGHPDTYAGYVPMSFADYIRKMNKSGEWGDHVTLQAAADRYGVKIFMITSFKDTCSIEILPNSQKSNRVIFLSFWAEVHYNSIYPEGELPEPCMKKKKKKWWDNIIN